MIGLSRGRRDGALAARYLDAAPQLRSASEILFLAPRRHLRLANALSAQLPAARIHVVRGRSFTAASLVKPAPNVRLVQCRTAEARAEYLVSIPPVDAVLDIDSNVASAQRRFQRVFWFLQPHGVYLLDCLCPDGCHSTLALSLDRSTEPDVPHGLADLRAAVAAVRRRDRFVVVEKGVRHRIGLRDHRANAILRARFGDAWGAVVQTRPALQFRPDLQIKEFGDRSKWWDQPGLVRATPDRISVPELTLRRYSDVTCWSEQRVAKDNLWLPDTFRHPYDRVLHHRRLVRKFGWTLSIRDGASDVPTRHVTAPCFFFDTEHAGHFGHVVTEVLSRHWGWVRAKECEPELRALVSRRAPGADLPAFQQRLFTALGIDADMIEYIEPREAVTVTNLYAATPMFSMPAYASPELAETWQLVGERLYRRDLATPRRLFISRRVRATRSCVNTEEVEAFMRERGYTVFFPEDHDLCIQVTAFRNAEIVAGFAGSNMFPLIGAGRKNVVTITGSSYGATNEFLISAINGGRLTYVVADSTVQHPPGGWAPAAYQSNFVLDVDLLAAALDDAEAFRSDAIRRATPEPQAPSRCTRV